MAIISILSSLRALKIKKAISLGSSRADPFWRPEGDKVIPCKDEHKKGQKWYGTNRGRR